MPPPPSTPLRPKKQKVSTSSMQTPNRPSAAVAKRAILQLTPEQCAIRNFVLDPNSNTSELKNLIDRSMKKNIISDPNIIRILAYAGCGKTKIAEIIYDEIKKVYTLSNQNPSCLVQYIVFNKAAEVDACKRGTFLPHEVRTVHALAKRYTNTGSVCADVKPETLITAFDLNRSVFNQAREEGMEALAQRFGIDFNSEDDDKFKRVVRSVAINIYETLKRFLWSDVDQVEDAHVYWKAREKHEPKRIWKPSFTEEWYVLKARELWLKMCDLRNGSIQFTHDGYLKAFERAHVNLSKPTTKEPVPIKFLIVDECQDTSPAMFNAFVSQQAKNGIMVFVVGDPRQRIYRFRGASEDFETCKVKKEYNLSISFRFGKPIAMWATRILGYSGTNIKANPVQSLASSKNWREKNADADILKANVTTRENIPDDVAAGWIKENLKGLSGF